MSRSHQRSFAIAKRQVEFLALFQIESENWNSFNAIEFRRSRMDVPRCVLQRRERILCVSWAGQIMSEEQNLRRRLAAEPFDVFRRVPLLGRIMIAVRDEGVVLERIGVVERVERDGNMLFTMGKAHDSEIDIGRVSRTVVDYSSQMKGKVLPRIEFQDASEKIIFSVVGLEGAEPFDAGLKVFGGIGLPPLSKPAPDDEPAKLDAADAGMQPLRAAREAEAEITIEMRCPGVTQRWRGLVPEVNPAMGFINIITSDFHLHLRGGHVKHWQRSAPAADGSVELMAVGANDLSLGLFLRGPSSAFGAA